ncbi:hypothetical protein Aconfl_43460 [Algoriphagus confluentis]|uniref:Uncharacterized protein n=1 Tax=Algoriphagus confluentis TaxID=1697556 RepID=A0ABQ6PUS1_9BACT|nr:hypothetical protein Aconfl_43460 [Algoriphagus confluentis]
MFLQGYSTINWDKNITFITYNHLNLPRTITFSGTNKKIEYWYIADGVKVLQVNTDGTTVHTIDYIEEFVFENSAISYILHEEGRASIESGVFQYEFFIKDHLGNPPRRKSRPSFGRGSCLPVAHINFLKSRQV